MKKLFLAMQFLTIVPFRNAGDVSEKEMGSTTTLFPLVGSVEGLVLALCAAVFLKVFPTELTNALIVLLLTVMNGGLHLDGLADTFDALASRGDREKKLSIMKDSTVGPMGVMAIVMVLLLKYVLFNAVFFHSSLGAYYAAVALMPVMSRWAMVPAAFYGRSARQDGLGRLFIEHTKMSQLLSATAAAVAVVVIICVIGAQLPSIMFHLMFAMPVLYLLGFAAVWFFNRHFGGMTGDSFGAVNELAVLVFLIMVVINNAKLV